jgi:CubicO group peptidase (beta-lactamase class C family)
MPKWYHFINKPIVNFVHEVAQWKAEGYRLVSYCLHEGTPDPTGSAGYCSGIWVKKVGPDWGIFPSGTYADMSSYKIKSSKTGYQPRLIAAAGHGHDDARFGLVVEQSPTYSALEIGLTGLEVLAPTVKSDPTLGFFDFQRSIGRFPVSVAVYGTNDGDVDGGNLLYAFVLQDQPSKIKDGTVHWNGLYFREADAARVNQALVNGFARADLAVVSKATSKWDRGIFAVYRDDPLEGYALYTEQTVEQAEELAPMNSGFWPIRIHGGGAVDSAQRFAIIYADYPHYKAPSRTLTVIRAEKARTLSARNAKLSVQPMREARPNPRVDRIVPPALIASTMAPSRFELTTIADLGTTPIRVQKDEAARGPGLPPPPLPEPPPPPDGGELGFQSPSYQPSEEAASVNIAPFWEVDKLFITTMKKFSIRAAQVAIAYEGKLAYAAAYTWAEPGYPVTQLETLMSVASISKSITALAVWELLDEGQLHPNDLVSPLLEREFADVAMATRTVAHLLPHLGYLDDDDTIDLEANPFAISAMANKPLPVDAPDKIDMMATMPSITKTSQAPNPSTTNPPAPLYSGAGYLLLGEIVRKRRAAAHYGTAVKNWLFWAVGITRGAVRVTSSMSALTQSTETRCHMRVPGFGFDVQGNLDASGNPAFAPWNYECGWAQIGHSAGGWAMAAVDLARLLSRFDRLFSEQTRDAILTEVADGWYGGFAKLTFPGFPELKSLMSPSTGGKMYWWDQPDLNVMLHNGALAGVASMYYRRQDSLVVAYAFNCDDGPASFVTDLNDRINAIKKWPADDLFPAVLAPPAMLSVRIIAGQCGIPFPLSVKHEIFGFANNQTNSLRAQLLWMQEECGP